VLSLPGGAGGNVEVSYKLLPTGPPPVSAYAPASGAVADWDYPSDAFDLLEGFRRQLTTSWDKKSPTEWVDLPQGQGIVRADTHTHTHIYTCAYRCTRRTFEREKTAAAFSGTRKTPIARLAG
jgi:hypothetical protein